MIAIYIISAIIVAVSIFIIKTFSPTEYKDAEAIKYPFEITFKHVKLCAIFVPLLNTAFAGYFIFRLFKKII